MNEVPPKVPTELTMKRAKAAWRVLMITNLVLGAYLFTLPRKKDRKKGHKFEKDKTIGEAPQPPTTTTSMDDKFPASIRRD
ncbi:hypothetical protein K1719_016441 [Acacia pycnantha]|nr:hypothetical protein K1719_016441 [Acacia pycnantha]